MKTNIKIFFGIATIMMVMVFGSPYVTQSKDNTQSAPEKVQSMYFKSYDYEQDEDYAGAIKALIPVYKEFPDAYTVNLRLGWLYYLKQSYANSVLHYQAAIKAAPTAVEPKLGSMLPLLAQEKYDDVVKTAFHVLALDSNNYYASLRLVYSLRMQGKYELAEKAADEMIALYPTDVSFLTEKALIKEAQEDYDAADHIFWDVLTLDPDNLEANDYMSYYEED